MDNPDYLITLIGIAAPIVATFFGIFLQSYLQKKKKSLIFEQLQSLSVKNKNILEDKFEIKYSDKLVNNLYVSTAIILNNGNLSINENDIIEPIKISYDETLIDCNVIEVDPKGIKVDQYANIDENSFEFKFNLLNPGDSFTLQFISLEPLSIPIITSRINGLSKINITSVSTQKLSLDSVYNIENSSSKNPFRHLRFVLSVVMFDMVSVRPLEYFALPGIVYIILGTYMGIVFFQKYSQGGHLALGPTILMVLLFMIGFIMFFSGLLLYSISGLSRRVK